MQVFRLVQTGHVDKVIAFDELPKRLLDGIEMRSPDGLPRHWKAFIGTHEKRIPSSMEKNPITGAMEKLTFPPEVGPFFYVLEYKDINKDKDRWQEINAFVRRAVDMKFRLKDKLEDMALPFAPDAMSEIKLEPENLEEEGAIIPIPIEFQEKTPAILDKDGKEVRAPLPEPSAGIKCEKCEKTFKNQQAVKMHAFRAHKEEAKEPTAV